MWGMMIMAVMIAIGGIYSMSTQRFASQSSIQLASVTLADTMSVYRTSVTNYFLQNKAILNTSVDIGALTLPAWYPTGDPGAATWQNFRDTNGVIYIFPKEKLPVGISVELARVSYNSILAGTYNEAANTLFSVSGSDTTINLAAVANKFSFYDGEPVWIAMIN